MWDIDQPYLENGRGIFVPQDIYLDARNRNKILASLLRTLERNGKVIEHIEIREKKKHIFLFCALQDEDAFLRSMLYDPHVWRRHAA